MQQSGRRYLAEAIGTFALVFVGTGAIVVNEPSGGVLRSRIAARGARRLIFGRETR